MPQQAFTDSNVYSVHMSTVKCGYVKAQNDSPVGWLDLGQQMASLWKDVSHALLLIARECIAVFRDRSGCYGVFDSHSWNARLWWNCNNADILSVQWHNQSPPPAVWESRNLCNLWVCTCFIRTRPARNCYYTCHNHGHSCPTNTKSNNKIQDTIIWK